MKQAIVYALETSEAQSSALTETLEHFNNAAQYVADVACSKRVFNKHDLQRMTYKTLREDFSMSAQMAIQAISKAVDSCRGIHNLRNKAAIPSPHIGERSSMVFDHRIMSFKGYSVVSLRCLDTRELVTSDPSFIMSSFSLKSPRSLGQSELTLLNGDFYLALTVDSSHRTPERVRQIMQSMIGLVQAYNATPETMRGPRNIEAVYQAFQSENPQHVLDTVAADEGVSVEPLNMEGVAPVRGVSPMTADLSKLVCVPMPHPTLRIDFEARQYECLQYECLQYACGRHDDDASPDDVDQRRHVPDLFLVATV